MQKNQDYVIALERQPSYYFDWSTFLLSIMLVAFGLLSIYSATYNSGMNVYFTKQLIYAFIGLAAMFTMMFLPERWVFTSSTIMYGLSILLLIVVLIFGTEHYGTKGWMNFGGMSFQPVEFSKFATTLFIARYLSMKGINIKAPRDLIPFLAAIFIPIGLIMLQPDTGSATVLLALAFGVLLWAGYDISILFLIIGLPIVIILSLFGTVYYIVSVSILSIIAASFQKKITITLVSIISFVLIGYLSPIIVNNLMPHQKDRIETFLNPEKDPIGKGYNVLQSVLAVGSGGMFGKGFLQGTQTQLRYIPKQWTDFIYCVPTEEFGFIGGSMVILLLAGLTYKAIKLASETDSKFMSLILVGIASIFFYHSFINIGMAIGILPVMGIPLPFLSYGGTALIVNMSFVGLMLNSFRAFRKRRS